MHKAERAVILAAGMGTRLRPLTLTTPKPLIEVGGQRIIDTSIRALRAFGIEEIYVVVGYLKEKFLPLEEEYPGLRLIENPWYDTTNNISSLYAAREHLENAIILEGDQIIRDTSVLAPDFARSGYSCIWSEETTREWFVRAEDGVITSCSPDGGAGGWEIHGISRWSAEDGRRLKGHLEALFERGPAEDKQLFWDAIPLLLYLDQYRPGVTPMDRDSVAEIDSLGELAVYEKKYVHTWKGENHEQ